MTTGRPEGVAVASLGLWAGPVEEGGWAAGGEGLAWGACMPANLHFCIEQRNARECAPRQILGHALAYSSQSWEGDSSYLNLSTLFILVASQLLVK